VTDNTESVETTLATTQQKTSSTGETLSPFGLRRPFLACRLPGRVFSCAHRTQWL